MAIPEPTLESAVKTLWLMQQDLADAVAKNKKRARADAVWGLEIFAEYSCHEIVRNGAAKSLREYATPSARVETHEAIVPMAGKA